MFTMFHANPRHRPWLIVSFLLFLIAGSLLLALR
jgi:hypothetical protein